MTGVGQVSQHGARDAELHGSVGVAHAAERRWAAEESDLAGRRTSFVLQVARCFPAEECEAHVVPLVALSCDRDRGRSTDAYRLSWEGVGSCFHGSCDAVAAALLTPLIAPDGRR